MKNILDEKATEELYNNLFDVTTKLSIFNQDRNEVTFTDLFIAISDYNFTVMWYGLGDDKKLEITDYVTLKDYNDFLIRGSRK